MRAEIRQLVPCGTSRRCRRMSLRAPWWRDGCATIRLPRISSCIPGDHGSAARRPLGGPGPADRHCGRGTRRLGWWLAGIGMVVAWIAGITIVGLPLAFWVVNRISTMLTLRPRTTHRLFVVGADGASHQPSVVRKHSHDALCSEREPLSGIWCLAGGHRPHHLRAVASPGRRARPARRA